MTQGHSGESAQPLPVTLVAHDVGGIGGMERQLEQLVLRLARAGHEVTVIARSCRMRAHPRVRFVRVPGPHRPFTLAYPWFFALGSVLVRRHRKGVVHVTGAIVANRADVATVHLCHRALHRRRPPRRVSRRTPAFVLNALIARWLSLAGEWWCYRPGRLAVVVGVSGGVQHEVKQCYPSVADRAVVIPNGVDRHVFRPMPGETVLAGALGGLTALFVGSEWEGKGLRLAIEAVARLREWRLVVVGRGDRSSYSRLATELGAVDRVQFLPPTRDLAPLYQAADAFLLPSAYETFSLVAHEAAACGLPLLTTRVSGVEDLLQDGLNGWFVQRDAADIAARLRALAADPSLRAAMGAAARRATVPYTWEAMYRSYAAVYERLAIGEASPQRQRAKAPA